MIYQELHVIKIIIILGCLNSRFIRFSKTFPSRCVPCVICKFVYFGFLTMDHIQVEYLDFLDDELRQNIYHQKVQQMIDENGQRLRLDINNLREYNPDRCKQLIKREEY